MPDAPKHSPGPWSHGLDMVPPDPGIEAAGGGCVAHVQCHGNINTVARTGEEFSHADAHLIAAAPDLYDACKAAAHLLRKLGGVNHDPEYSQLLAALAKADGR